jgi:hypothetical protein
VERRNETPVYVAGARNTREFLEWIRAKSGGRTVAQIKSEYLMLVPETADGALSSIGEGEGVSFHAFSLSLSWRTDAYAYC